MKQREAQRGSCRRRPPPARPAAAAHGCRRSGRLPLQARIQAINLARADSANVLSSPGLLAWAQAQGLWSPAKGRFNWCGRGRGIGGRVAGNACPRLPRSRPPCAT